MLLPSACSDSNAAGVGATTGASDEVTSEGETQGDSEPTGADDTVADETRGGETDTYDATDSEDTGSDAGVPAILPTPKTVLTGPGAFTLTAETRIVVSDPSLNEHAAVLQEEIHRITGIRPALTRTEAPSAGDIQLSLDETLPPDAYTLDVAETVAIAGTDYYALCTGTSTLVQILGTSGTTIEGVRIEDEPDYRFRAIEIDVARKRHTVEQLRAMIDLSRFYRFRYVAVHFTDDQGFPFPLSAFPNMNDGTQSLTTTYALEDMVDLERYSQARGITIIPELDVPGHTSMMRNNYPSIFDDGSGQFAVDSAACRDAVTGIIDEMLAVFSSTPYMHIGGDESSIGNFASFFNHLVDHIDTEHGKRALAWEGFSPAQGVSTDVVILAWNGDFAPQALIDAGYDVVNAGWYNYVVPHYPMREGLSAAPQAELFNTHLWGQAWSPLSFRHLQPGHSTTTGIDIEPNDGLRGGLMAYWEGWGYQTVPTMRTRMAAYAARTWNAPAETSFEDWRTRFDRLDEVVEEIMFPVSIDGSELLPTTPNGIRPYRKKFDGAAIDVTMTSSLPGEIRYTFVPGYFQGYESQFGEEPTSTSTLYTGPIPIAETGVLHAALFDDAGAMIGHPQRFDLEAVSVTPSKSLNKPVTVSDSVYGDDIDVWWERPPSVVTDGVDGQTGSRLNTFTVWRKPGSGDVQVTVDLERPEEISEVKLFLDEDFVATFRVLSSEDGVDWTVLEDRSANTEPNTAAGWTFTFPPVSARYVRVDLISSNLVGGKARIVDLQVN